MKQTACNSQMHQVDANKSQTTQILFQHPTKAEQSNFKPKLQQVLFRAGELVIVGLAAGLVASGIVLAAAMGAN